MAAVSNYTHCRGCGGWLDPKTGQVDDGLCGKLAAARGCCAKFHDWLGRERTDNLTATFGPNFWQSALWSVAIDEWLAATR